MSRQVDCYDRRIDDGGAGHFRWYWNEYGSDIEDLDILGTHADAHEFAVELPLSFWTKTSSE